MCLTWKLKSFLMLVLNKVNQSSYRKNIKLTKQALTRGILRGMKSSIPIHSLCSKQKAFLESYYLSLS